jgi:hypothetical protein
VKPLGVYVLEHLDLTFIQRMQGANRRLEYNIWKHHKQALCPSLPCIICAVAGRRVVANDLVVDVSQSDFILSP